MNDEVVKEGSHAMASNHGRTGHELHPRTNDYDSFAAAYAAETDDGLVNAYYERPEMLRLAGDVSGRTVLDAGCGTGVLTAELDARGASVTGIDSSPQMLQLARRRVNDAVELRLADLRDPLPFGDRSFDDVIASLVLHYLENWRPTLAEMRRVLRPGGRLFVSVDHPFVAYADATPRPDYFATTSYEFDWEFGEHRVSMKFWRRPLHVMLDEVASAGFRIVAISEPRPATEARELFPDGFVRLSTTPCFLFLSLEVSG
ncbi:class I SAM-dependent methyltransferase [Microbacterium sp.]|uniref:class I SAM-dependent methyltransferase n=1 Tax=Microbacterium sp. TaxID=51671 RepID=UPI002736DD18|nr:class I SAM-dependent methyltransferase [Microbacterium sp.]MDP3950895.1 class I SAM-dependent methyltransferase [Microbacterium sp.]